MIIIINGKSGVGKDTLISACDRNLVCGTENHYVYNISSIDPIKKIAEFGGWNGVKDEKGRKLLNILKKAFTEYDDTPLYKTLAEVLSIHQTFDYFGEPVVFIHIREPEEIQKMVDTTREMGIRTFTLLVRRTEIDEGGFVNIGDEKVEDYGYDFIFNNNDEIDMSKERFKSLVLTMVNLNRKEESMR